MNPGALNLKGSTQPEISSEAVDAIARMLSTDAASFWRAALANDGPMEIWEINGERWLYNGNHRFQAALRLEVDIPDDHILIVDRRGSTIPTWRFDQMTWIVEKKEGL